jgi:hypothetical protein
MGILSKIKASQAFVKLEDEVRREAVTMGQQFPSLEPFEYLLRIWQGQMRKRGNEMLALNGEHIVHLWAILPNPKRAIELLARHIGAYSIPNFQEVSYFEELNAAMGPIAASIQRDNGATLNSLFQDANPRSYAVFLEKHGRGPFTPADSSGIEELMRYSK